MGLLSVFKRWCRRRIKDHKPKSPQNYKSFEATGQMLDDIRDIKKIIGSESLGNAVSTGLDFFADFLLEQVSGRVLVSIPKELLEKVRIIVGEEILVVYNNLIKDEEAALAFLVRQRADRGMRELVQNQIEEEDES